MNTWQTGDIVFYSSGLSTYRVRAAFVEHDGTDSIVKLLSDSDSFDAGDIVRVTTSNLYNATAAARDRERT